MARNVTLSAALICGDVHVGVLARCLKSILDAPGGPAAEEIVIGWNGSDDAAFAAALTAAFGALDGISNLPPLPLGEEATVFFHGTIRVVVHRYAWANNFADARNANWSRTTGEWVYYIDADDLLVGPNDPAYADSLECDPPATATETYPVNGSLVDYFRQLPLHVNVVRAPYNYVSSDKGRPVIRKRRPRAARWSEGHFCWTSEVHEVVVSALGREIGVWAPGFLLVHAPPVSEEDRKVRNQPILAAQVSRLQAEGQAIPATLVYSQAVCLMGNHEFEPASAMFEQAASSYDAGSEDRAYYLLLAARCAMEAEDFERAGKMAVTAIGFSPLRPEGYFAASEASFRMMDFPKCTTWYEAGKDKRPPSGGPMVDDRFERCLRPVAYAGIAYLRDGHYREALEVAEKALKEATEPLALKIKAEAEAAIAFQRIAETASGLASSLLAIGYAKTAKHLLDAVSAFNDFHAVRRAVQERLDAPFVEIPDGTVKTLLLQGHHALTVPLDAVEAPVEAFAALAQAAPEGGSIRVAVTDPKASDSFSIAARVDGINAETLRAIVESHGEIDHLSLAEQMLVVDVKRRKAVVPRTPDVTFFCPVFAEPWGPWRIQQNGTGGSEESVIYLARELQSRGLNVDVYAPLDVTQHRGLHVEGGVYWRPLDAFDPIKRISGIAIAHRAPFAVRMHAFDPKRLFVWHQDAQYHAGWNAAIASTVRNLWVSKWQRDALLKQVMLKPSDSATPFDHFGAVIGNGIPQSALDVPFGERTPLSCAYLSSPVRGLAELLGLWPYICSSFPNATLRVYYGWETLRVFPGMAKAQRTMLARVRKTKNVEYVGRIAQSELERDLVTRSCWAYPCMFAEGFANAGIRATAAGLVPVYRRTAALPEVQFPSPYSVPDVEWSAHGGAKLYATALLQALQDEKDSKIDAGVRQGYRDWAKRWTWDRCATALIAEFERSGALGKQEAVA